MEGVSKADWRRSRAKGRAGLRWIWTAGLRQAYRVGSGGLSLVVAWRDAPAHPLGGGGGSPAIGLVG